MFKLTQSHINLIPSYSSLNISGYLFSAFGHQQSLQRSLPQCWADYEKGTLAIITYSQREVLPLWKYCDPKIRFLDKNIAFLEDHTHECRTVFPNLIKLSTVLEYQSEISYHIFWFSVWCVMNLQFILNCWQVHWLLNYSVVARHLKRKTGFIACGHTWGIVQSQNSCGKMSKLSNKLGVPLFPLVLSHQTDFLSSLHATTRDLQKSQVPESSQAGRSEGCVLAQKTT